MQGVRVLGGFGYMELQGGDETNLVAKGGDGATWEAAW
ncbi:hypothetical protein Tco_1162244, partial [Tanacetum coccineum]